MALLDSVTGKIVRDYSIEELIEAANRMRGYDLVALCAAGSGHAGGTLSIMDIAAALYLKVANHDPENPDWPQRDRVIWSAGHKAPSLYLSLAFAGFCKLEDVATLRKLGSSFQGHPHWLKLRGVEVSTGSLGQGLSIAVGVALAGKLNQQNYRTFCVMGDGEQQEGQIWEAAMEAAHHKLDNLIGIVDCNGLQIDGPVAEVMNIDPLEQKYKSFGWDVMQIDGHDMDQVVKALSASNARYGQAAGGSGENGQGQGRQLHGERSRLARKSSQPRGDDQGLAGAWTGRKDSLCEPVRACRKLSAPGDSCAQRKAAALQPRLLVEQPDCDERTDGADAEGVRPGARDNLAKTNVWSASASTFQVRSHSAIFTLASRSARNAGSLWESRSSPQRRRRQGWPKKASSRSSVRMQRSQPQETSIRSGPRSATAISTS